MAIVRTIHGISYNWESGQAGWGTDVNQNFLDIGMFSNIAVINMSTNTPPVSPSAEDAYIVAAGGSGDWEFQDGKLTIWGYEVGAVARSWVFLEPKAGWTVLNLDNDTLFAYNGTSWSTNGFTFTFV